MKSTNGRRKNMIRKIVVATILGVLMCASGAIAQEGRWQEISVQGTGFFTKDSSGNGINQHATDTGGFLLSYRYHFNRWLAADASYGYARNTQQNFTSSSTLSEEHTSELQSHLKLVCRLLLEKKTKNRTPVATTSRKNYERTPPQHKSAK